MSAVFLLWVPGWEIPWFLPGTLVSSQKPSTIFPFNLYLSMGFSLPSGTTQPLSLNVCNDLAPPIHWASAYFIKVPSRFHSVTSVTGWKGTVSVRWEELFKTECLYPGKIQSLFLFCARPPDRQERKECVQQHTESLCSWRQETLLGWIGPNLWLGRTVFKKKSSKTSISDSAFDFNVLEFSDKCYF